ncbi:hypothetical protein ID866_12578 [Astraeus odoratus]|nr:hypothetical protein ID866_12578 [Astraeus odoratus]
MEGLKGCRGMGRCRAEGPGGEAVGHGSAAFRVGGGTPVGC